MAYGSNSMVKRQMPIKLARKAMLNGLVIRGYAKNKLFGTD